MTSLPPNSAASPILSGDFMARLDRLDVLSRKILAGKMQGERRSKKKGQSVEFADYRQYVAGDDLRFIDWNLYARLDRLFLRLFMEEEDLTVAVLIDASLSMDYGQPNKFHYARQVAAALGYIGLVHYNRVSLIGLTDRNDTQLPNLRGRRPIGQMLDFLTHLQPAGAANLAESLKRFALTHRGKGVVVLLSDLLDKGDYAQSVRYLLGDRFDLYVIQVLSPQEIDPAKAGVLGDLRLRDVEDADVAEVSVTPALLKRYQANLQAYCQHLRQESVKRGITYMVSDTSVPFEDLVLRYLRQRGLVG